MYRLLLCYGTVSPVANTIATCSNHNMDPAVVASSQFDQLWKSPLPGTYAGAPEQIFSQPLVYTPSNGTKQYVYWATTQNNVYKMDAKTGEIVASRNLHIPFLTADLNGCVDINPTVGITATGVIDPDTDTLYLTAKTYADQNGGQTAQGLNAGRYFVHAINVNDLSERPNFPIALDGITARNNEPRVFTGGIHHQRPGLLHAGNYIYAGFASHCVQYNFTGWIIGWDKGTGKIVEHFATEGAGVNSPIKGGGVWMSGGGLASDDKGSIFFGTGNGYASQLATVPVNGYQPPTALEEAAVHMSQQADGSLTMVDFFMPWEKQALDGADKDLGTSPLELLPSEFSCGDVKRIGVITGKSGKTYWLNLDNLGGYRNGHGDSGMDDIIQVYQNDNSVYAGAGVYPLEGGYIYINVIQHPSNVFKFSCTNGKPSFTLVATSPETNAYILGVSHGTTTSLNGQPGTGLLWVTDVQGLNLRIYNAVPNAGKLNLLRSFSIDGVTKFTRPVFGDGIVYVGTTKGYVYAFGSPVNSPLNCTSPVDFGTVDRQTGNQTVPTNSTTSASQPVTCKANIALTVTGIDINSNTDFSVTKVPTVPLDMKAGDTITVTGVFKPTNVGLLSANIVFNTTNSVAGYSTSTNARLVGTGRSPGPLLDVSPNTVTFQGVVTGQDNSGVTENVILANRGNSPLTVQSVMYSEDANGTYSTWSRNTPNLQVGKFTLMNIPTTVDANGAITVSIKFDSSTSGTFAGFVKFVTDGGSASISIAATSGPPAKAVIEFQTIDGKGWVPYVVGQTFTFGNVTENQNLPLKFRVTNGAPAGGVNLSLTVSKPPFGVPGLIRAANQVDLAEGTSLAPGASGTAVITCSVPKSQWNVDPYNNGTALWTLNTNDPNLGKHSIEFSCEAVSEQAPPLRPDGQGKYRYIGCFKENNPGRQLPNQLYSLDQSTNALCISACADKNYAFCGTQYNRECWGGPSIPNLQVPDNYCNYPCSGDLNQVCGGNGVGAGAGGTYISVFQNPDAGTGQPQPGAPVVNPGVDGYKSIGCYTESTQGRALPNGAQTDKKTVKQCIDACKTTQYTYAGVEYGGECWCGNAFSAGAVPAPIGDCNMLCNDNQTEYCGGGSRLNVYQVDIASTTTSASSTVPPTSLFSSSVIVSSSTVSSSAVVTSSTSTTSSAAPTQTGPVVKDVVAGKWKSQGCWTEPQNRALPDKSYADDMMTLESCAKFCDGFAYFGTEYARECWCGKALDPDSKLATSQDECNMLCGGDKLEYCGSGGRLNVYQVIPVSTSSAPASTTVVPPSSGVDTAVPPSSVVTTSSAAPTPTGPVKKAVVAGNWNLLNCMTEATNGRALNENSYADDNMTLESCAKFCSGFTYFGTEYGRECYCGNNFRAGSVVATNQGDCNMVCAGDKFEICGGGSRLIAYQAADKNTTTTASTPIDPPPPQPPTTAASVSSPVASSAPAKPTPTGPAKKDTVADIWSFQGCYTEATNKRALSAKTYADDKMTLESCASFCKAYAFFGTEYGRECYCGDALNTGSALATNQKDCNFACAGDKSEYCGAGNRLELYQKASTTSSSTAPVSTAAATSPASPVTSSQTANEGNQDAISSQPSSSLQQPTSPASSASQLPKNTDTVVTTSPASSSLTSSQAAKPTPTGPTVSEGNANFTYYACVSEPSQGRLLPQQIWNDNKNMTIEACLKKCSNYGWAGVEYGQECWCGNQLRLDGGQAAKTPGKNVSNSDCKFLCPGNKTEYCGAGSRMNVYVLKELVQDGVDSATLGPYKPKSA